MLTAFCRYVPALALPWLVLGTACAERVRSGPVAEDDIAARVGSLIVMSPFAAEPVTGEVGVLYFQIANTGLQADTLLLVTTDVAGDVSLHDQADDGVSMRMVPVERLEIPGGQTVRLEPGGLHVMLRDIIQPYAAGDSLAVTASFSTAGEVSFRVPVVSYSDVAERSAHAH